MATPDMPSETPNRSSSLLAWSTAIAGLGVLHLATVRLGSLYSLLTTAVGLAGVVLVVRPFVAVYMILALRIAIDMLWWMDRIGKFTAQQVTSGVLSLLIGIIALAVVRRTQRHPQWTGLSIFLLLSVFGAIQTGDTLTGVDQFMRVGSPLLLALIVTELLDTPSRRHQAVITLAASLIIPIVISLYKLAKGELDSLLDGYPRLLGPYQNFQNLAFAATFSTSIALMLWQLWHQQHPWRARIALTYAAASLTALYYTYARTPAVGLAAFILMFLTLSRRYGLTLLGTLAIGVALATSPVLQDRYDDIVIAAVTDDAIEARTIGSGRFAIWEDAFNRYTQKPAFYILFGSGLASDRLESRAKLDAHNDYISIFYQLGPIGFGLTLWFHVLVAKESWRLASRSKDPWNINYGRFMVALSTMVFVGNMLSNAYVSRPHSAWLYWALAGIVFAANADDPDVGALRVHRSRRLSPAARISGN